MGEYSAIQLLLILTLVLTVVSLLPVGHLEDANHYPYKIYKVRSTLTCRICCFVVLIY